MKISPQISTWDVEFKTRPFSSSIFRGIVMQADCQISATNLNCELGVAPFPRITVASARFRLGFPSN